jgi:hypothetical protein
LNTIGGLEGRGRIHLQIRGHMGYLPKCLMRVGGERAAQGVGTILGETIVRVAASGRSNGRDR